MLNPLLGPQSPTQPYQSTVNSINTHQISGDNLIGTTNTEYGIVTDNTAVLVAAKYNWDPFKFFIGYEHITQNNPSHPLGVGASAQGGYLLSGFTQIEPDEKYDELPAKVVAIFGEGKSRHWGPARRVVFSPDGSRYISAGDDGKVRVWSLGNNKEILALNAGNAAVLHLGFTDRGKSVVAATADGMVTIWNGDTGQSQTFQGPVRTPTALAVTVLSPGASCELPASVTAPRICPLPPSLALVTLTAPEPVEPVALLARSVPPATLVPRL